MNAIFFAETPEIGLPVAAAAGLALSVLILAFPRLSGLARPRLPRLPFSRAG